MIEIEQQSLFDYSVLDTETRTFVQEKARAIHVHLDRIDDEAIALGFDLIEVKDTLAHGQFGEWIQSEFGMTVRTAQRLMTLAENYNPNATPASHLGWSVRYELLSAPETVVEMVESGEIPPTRSAIREAKREVLQSLPAITSPDDLPATFGLVNGQPFTMPLPGESHPTTVGYTAKSNALTALQSSDSNEWYTPIQYVDAARELMGGIDCDPASNELANQVIQAERYYTKKDNGLFQPWRGRVWLNPPYGFDNGGSNQEVWTRQLIERFAAGLVTEAVLLVNANTEAKWFQPLYDYRICFTNHRIRFYNETGDSSQPTQGNALVYFGSQQQRFVALFRRFGRVGTFQ